jgi:hypothetical protein
MRAAPRLAACTLLLLAASACNAISGVGDLVFVQGSGGAAGMPDAGMPDAGSPDAGTGGAGGSDGGGTGGSGGVSPCESATGCAKIRWNGDCYNTQVNAHGSVTITKTPTGAGMADVTLEGELAIFSQTYGYTRQELPPGFFPIKEGPYECLVQNLAGMGDVSDVGNGKGKGVYVLQPDLDFYTHAVLWFPEKFYNGTYTLSCSWNTEEANPGNLWKNCPGITVLQ